MLMGEASPDGKRSSSVGFDDEFASPLSHNADAIGEGANDVAGMPHAAGPDER